MFSHLTIRVKIEIGDFFTKQNVNLQMSLKLIKCQKNLIKLTWKLKLQTMGKEKVHDVLKNLTWIIGKWKSISAHVEYPTMKNVVKFDEILEFKSMGQPLLNYNSVTTHPQNKSVMHLENGFLRVDDDKCTIAFMTAQNFGLSTLEEGYVKDNTMVLQTACIGIMKFAKQTVLAIHRFYRLNEKGELQYCVLMETPQTPLVKHVEAVYKKEEECPKDD